MRFKVDLSWAWPLAAPSPMPLVGLFSRYIHHSHDQRDGSIQDRLEVRLVVVNGQGDAPHVSLPRGLQELRKP